MKPICFQFISTLQQQDCSNPNTAILSGRLEYITEIKTRLKILSTLLTNYEPGTKKKVTFFRESQWLVVLHNRYYVSIFTCVIQNALTEQERDAGFNWFLQAYQPIERLPV